MGGNAPMPETSRTPERRSPRPVVRDAPWLDHRSPWSPMGKVAVEVSRRGKGQRAVLLDGNLLCLTVYRRGALAVKRVIEGLAGRG